MPLDAVALVVPPCGKESAFSWSSRGAPHLPVFSLSSLPVCPVCQIDMLLASEQQAILYPELQTLKCGKCRLMFTGRLREDVGSARRWTSSGGAPGVRGGRGLGSVKGTQPIVAPLCLAAETREIAR